MTSTLTRRALLLSLFVVLFDQWSKWYMLEAVDIDVIGRIQVNRFFDLVMVWNHGISFGMMSAHGSQSALFLILMALGITALLLTWLQDTHSRAGAYAIGLVIGGALGNIVDRFRFGAVADFFYFHYESFYWPAFNVADSAICIGVALLCGQSMLSSPRKQHQP